MRPPLLNGRTVHVTHQCTSAGRTVRPLADEAPTTTGALTLSGAEHFDRDAAVEPDVAGEMNGAHSAASELAFDHVAAGDEYRAEATCERQTSFREPAGPLKIRSKLR